MERIRLKCKYGSEIRSVLVPRNVQFIDLKRRLSQDFGFDVSLKYEDEEGDLILLASQNDLTDLLDYNQAENNQTISLMVYEQILPQLLTKTPSSKSLLTPTLTPISSSLSSTNSNRNYLPTLDSHKSNVIEGNFPRWKKGEILGQGAFGVVYLGLNLNGELMAVKQLLTEEVSKKELNELKNEINLLKKLKHNNIVTYLGTELTSSSLSIFLEYVPGGSLKNLIDKFGPLEESIVRIYTRQLCLGLEYLHRNGIAHRDIKGANCLVGNDGVIKLADFGSSKHWNSNPMSTNASFSTSNSSPLNSIRTSSITGTNNGQDLKGTIAWMAPEIMRIYGGESLKGINTSNSDNTQISWRKADIWSLACTTLEMMTGKPPWQQFDNLVTIMFHLACQTTLPEFPVDPSVDLTSFLTQCLQRDAQLRPEVTVLLLHPFVVSVSGLINSSSVTSFSSSQLIRPTTTMGIKTLGSSSSTQFIDGNFDGLFSPNDINSKSNTNNFPTLTPRSNNPSSSSLLNNTPAATSSLKVKTNSHTNSSSILSSPLMIDTDQIINNSNNLFESDIRERGDGEETPYTISNINDYPTISTQNKMNTIKTKANSYDFDGDVSFSNEYSSMSNKNEKSIKHLEKNEKISKKNPSKNSKLNISEIEIDDDDDENDNNSLNKLEIFSYSLENDEYLSDFTNMEDSHNLDDSIISKHDITQSNIHHGGSHVDYETQSVVSNSSNCLTTKGRNRHKYLEPLESVNIQSVNASNSSSRSSSTTKKRKNRSNSFSAKTQTQSTDQKGLQSNRSISARTREGRDREGKERDRDLRKDSELKFTLNFDSKDEGEINTVKKLEFSPIIENDETNSPEGFKTSNKYNVNHDDSLIIDYLNEDTDKIDEYTKKSHSVNKKKVKSMNSPSKARISSGSKSNISSISQLKNDIQVEQQELEQETSKSRTKKKTSAINTQDNSIRRTRSRQEKNDDDILSPSSSTSFLSPSSSSAFLHKTNNTKSKESLLMKKNNRKEAKKDDLDISCDSLDSMLISGIHVSPRGSSPRTLIKKSLRNMSEDEQNLFSDIDLDLDEKSCEIDEKKKKKQSKYYEKIEVEVSKGSDENDEIEEEERDFYDFSQKKPILLEEHSGAITRLKIAKGGQYLLSSSTDGTIRIWEANSTNSKCILDASSFVENPSIEKNRPETVPDSKRNPELNEDSTQVSSTFLGTSANAPSTCPTSAPYNSMNQNRIKVLNLWCDENLETVWGSSSDLSIRLWSGVEGIGKPIRLLRGHEDSITCLEGIDPNYSNSSSSVTSSISSSILIASGSNDRSVRIWDSRSKKGQAFVFRGHGDSVLTMKWVEGGRALVSAGKDKMIKIWDTRAGRLRCTMEKHFGSVHMLRVLQSDLVSDKERDQVAFVSAGKDHMINFWTSSGDCIASHTAHRGSISYLSEVFYPSLINGGLEKINSNCLWSNSLPHLLSIGNDNTIKLWDLKKCKNVLEIPSAISLPPSTILSPSNPSSSSPSSPSPCLGTITRAVWTGPYGGFMTATSSGIVRTFDPYTNSNNEGTNTNSWKVSDIGGFGTNNNPVSSPCSDLVSSSPYTHFKSENLIISACSTRNGKILSWTS